MSGAEERRRHRRVQLRIPVTMLGSKEQPMSRDLSEGGMFIETPVARDVGAVLPVRLVHPDTGEVIPAVCQVVRQVRDEAGGLLGLGLRFANTDESFGDRIRNLVHDLVEDGAAEVHAAEEPANDDQLTVVELDEPEISWENEADGDESVEVLVVGADGTEHPGIPIIWPDTRPEKIPGALRHGLTPMQLRLLPFIDGNNTVEEVASGAGLQLSGALAELSDMARRAVIRIPSQPTTDDDLDAWESSTDASEPHTAKPLFPGRTEHVEEQERWRQARTLVTQGLAAERNDQLVEAVTLLEDALELNPPNAANIHARLALLGIDQLGDLDLAQRHALAVQELEPHRPHGARLLRRIARLRIRGVKPQRKKKQPRKTAPRPVLGKPKKAARPTRARTLIATVAFLAIVGLIGWNVNRYLLPLLEAPPRLDVSQLASLVPAVDARIRNGKLFVTVSDSWETLTTMEKSDQLKRLADWARQTHGLNEVVLADQTPVLRARVRNSEVEVFAR